MEHIFDYFMEPIVNGFEEVHLTVEKGTKKELKEALEEITRLNRGVENRIIHLDATNVKDIKTIAHYLSYSLFLYRNMGHHHLKVLLVKLSSDFEVSQLTEENKKEFSTLIGLGGSWDTYLSCENVNWGAINKQITDGVTNILKRYEEVVEKYKPYTKQISKESKRLKFGRKWNFHIKNTDILTFYKSCFNEIQYVVEPSLCCNPNPSFQRGLVWSKEKKKSFILSILNEIPIGSFYVNEPNSYDHQLTLSEGYGSLLWDGKQRLHALHDFFKGEFSVNLNGEEIYYYDNPIFFYNKFNNCMITKHISKFETLREIIEAYVVINSAQVKHTDEDLQKAINYLENQSNS